ncbi:MAG TPA: hypothetical protein VJS91_08330 [Nitrososphaeraceae archaeon]|nr:hypothetical protein [Nitrososphaeraceae archaeon]
MDTILSNVEKNGTFDKNYTLDHYSKFYNYSKIIVTETSIAVEIKRLVQ